MIGIFAGFLTLLFLAAVGKRILNSISLKPSPEETIIFSSALGLGLLGFGILALGLAGQLNLQGITILMIVIGVVGLRALGDLEDSFRKLCKSWEIPSCILLKTTVGLSLLTLSCVICGVIAPETANDSLCYHLHVPKIYLGQGWIGKIPYEVNSLFPFFMEMLFTVGVAFKNIAFAKTFHLFTGILTAAAIITTGRKLASNFAAWTAGLLFLTTPGIVNQMAMTYVDVALSCFSFLSLIAYLQWNQTRKNGWLTLSGLMAGIAMGIKYLALIGVLGILILLLFDLFSKKTAKRGKILSSFLFPLCLAGGYWYLRCWIELGNPVYPYFYQIFKTGDSTIQYSDIGVSKTLLHFLTIPWTMSMKPQIFEGFGDNIGPAYLAFVPLVLLAKKNPIIKRLSVYAAFYLLCWFLLGQSLRFFFPALPVLAVLIAAGLDSTRSFDPLPRRVISFALLGVFLIHTTLALYHYRGTFMVASGKISEADYLLDKERSYGIAAYANKNLPKDAKILSAVEVRMFYFQNSIVREDIYAAQTYYDEKAASPEMVREALKKAGFTHVLVTRTGIQDLSLFGPNRIQRLLIEGSQNSLALSMAPLYTYTFTGPDQPKITYTLYKL